MPTIDTAIIGGGMSGLYSAWRLATARPEAAAGVHVFEMSNRTGGRLETIRMAGMPHVPAELGGMRIMSSQILVNTLVAQLGLPVVPFPMGGSSNRQYLRGRHFEVKDYADPAKVPYDLRSDEKGLSPAQLVVKAITSVIPGAETMTPVQLREACAAATLNGFPLRQHGFWQVLGNRLSIEAYNLALAGGGFDSVLTNWNAAEAICWYMADWSTNPDATPYTRLQNGYETLPNCLRDRLVELGGGVHLDRELIALNRRSDDCYALTFYDHAAGREHEVVAGRVILAMPKRSLERLVAHPLERAGPSHFFEMPGVRSLLDSVEGHALYKFALAYPEPWWHASGLASGDSVTDLPLRQIYYFETEGEMHGGNPKNRNSLLVASYTDGISVNYWEGVRASGPRFIGRPNDFAEASRAAETDIYAVSALMVDEANRQLAEVHGLVDIPRPYDAAFRDWGDDPYGGGWHSWNIDVDATATMPRVIRPVDSEDVFICGEAYSTYQGWVEGALQTAEMMLTSHFGLQPFVNAP